MKIHFHHLILHVAFLSLLQVLSPFQKQLNAQQLPDVYGVPYTDTFEFTKFISAQTIYVTELKAGGNFDLVQLNDEYEGYISNRPDLEFQYTAASDTDLVFYAEAVNSDHDLILLVYTPENRFYFADDTEEFKYTDNSNKMDPEFTLENPTSGTYRVWIGNFDGTELVNANFGIFEINESYIPGSEAFYEEQASIYVLPTVQGLNYENGEASSGEVTLETGFLPDPFIKSITAGGDMELSENNPIDGMVDENPDFRLHYNNSTSSYPLVISIDSEEDTFLLVYSEADNSWF